jgi:hypothetical protein
MKLTRDVYQIAILCVALALPLPGVTRAQAKPDINQQLQRAIARVRKAKTITAKSDAAERLVTLIDDRDCSDVTDQTIQSLISLLDMPEDSVRTWVAAALGQIGPRAKAAVPKLLSILADIECKDLDFSSEATIPIALKRMGVTPPPRNCPQAR